MTVTKNVAAAVGLVTIPAVVATKVVLRALEGPDFLDPAIPPPCWVPVHLHDRATHVHAGGTDTLRIHITNLGHEDQTYEISTNTPAVIPSMPAIHLGPLEHADIVLDYPVASGAPHGPLAPVVVTVKGCKTYRLRWLVHVAPRLKKHASLHRVSIHDQADVDIHDQPDFQHHWYDHFYTEHGCSHDA